MKPCLDAAHSGRKNNLARMPAWHIGQEQHATCHNAQATFSPPEPEQLTVISDGVYEGDMVQGVRHASPPHM
ncbi:hypothetical protein [Komagataeibacter xylinus]|uniref:hypothetical protein n=1 Tax=Komagataeibacter xylinus TaxID=28448 RepID=UPI0019816175|nr:hypothetical protein [Komagataeibacter xylinus]